MKYELQADGAIHLRFEKDELAEVIWLLRHLRSRAGYDPIEVEEALAIVEGLYFNQGKTDKTKH